MSRTFTIEIKNYDLSESDIYMALDNYMEELSNDGEVDEQLQFEVTALD